MGEIDSKAFIAAAKRKYSGDEVECRAAELCAEWDSLLRNSNWHPFKIVADGNRRKVCIRFVWIIRVIAVVHCNYCTMLADNVGRRR